MLSGNGTGKASSRLVRLLSLLQEYNFTVRYIAGGKNVRADCLSRMPVSNTSEIECSENEHVVSYVENIFTNNCSVIYQDWLKASEEDTAMKRVFAYLDTGQKRNRLSPH